MNRPHVFLLDIQLSNCYNVSLCHEILTCLGVYLLRQASDFSRLNNTILWNWPFYKKDKNMCFQFLYYYFKEFNQSTTWKDQGFDKYDQFNYRLRYIFPFTQCERFDIREIYIGYTSGRQIAHTKDAESIIIGVRLQ
ncbi:MAG: hypothetical protein V1749_10860 [Candidatus Desantisbacteria bacterium]